ncbi:hypothetical protein QTP70_015966, partial [Hemibagrus guttatus]
AVPEEVPKSPPPQKRLTIYILESAPLEDQVQMAHDYMLPLVEEIHPTDANQITWMIVQEENNFEIMNIISDPELLQTKVDKMDTLLKARAAGYKPCSFKAGYTLDGVPTHRRVHTLSHSLTQSYTTGNLEMPINLPCMSLDWGRKSEYPEEMGRTCKYPRGMGRTCKLQTHMAEAGIEPPTLEV